ncbi:cell surface A33 antigen-like [Fundulus diaphanus]
MVSSGVSAITINIPQDVYEVERGKNIVLPCTFQSAQNNPTLVIVSCPHGISDIKSKYEGRVSIDVDISAGKADLKISSITPDDNMVFEYRVQIPRDDEGKPADTTRLVVKVPPTPPICKVQGKAEYGQNINLTCVSEEGSPPPTYKWESRDVRDVPRVLDKGGILSLYDISKETSGYYICTSSNKISSATCNIPVAVLPPATNTDSTAGIRAILNLFCGLDRDQRALS